MGDTLTMGTGGAQNAHILVGDLLNGVYEVRGVIGEGGMGRVYDAYDLRLKRPVAIKAARQIEHVDGESRLVKEAQALAAIRHPSLVAVHAVGTHAGIDYVVMERVFGVSLEAQLEKLQLAGRRFPIAEAIDVLSELADALAAVHRAGIAHRDVKPANVMLAPGNRVVLMDLGIFLPEFAAGSQPVVSGTPHYMAPESISASVQTGAGHLVDVYAFGVVAFEVLAGERPFDGDTNVRIFDGHLFHAVPDLFATRSDAPTALVELVTECLAKDPLDRPSSMEVVRHRLRSVARPSTVPPSAVVSTQPLDILIVDDDPDARELLRSAVAQAAPGADVRIATRADRALALVRERPPDLLLLDLNLPGMNGVELLMYLRGTRLAEKCTIVSVSGSTAVGDRALLQQLGVVEMVPKGPHAATQLQALVRRRARTNR